MNIYIQKNINNILQQATCNVKYNQLDYLKSIIKLIYLCKRRPIYYLKVLNKVIVVSHALGGYTRLRNSM